MTFAPRPADFELVDQTRVRPRVTSCPLPSARSRRIEHRADSHRNDTRTPQLRASRILRNLLAHNPGVEHFTVQGIVDGIEQGGTAASLMLFSIPSIVPIPGTAELVGPPTMAVSSSLISGRRLRLPLAILERKVPRRALALAIHAVLPVLERAEKLTKKRWSWLCTPSAQRIVGVIVFLLALPLTFPLLGFGLPHATSLFTIALGMIEKDGVTIALGVTAGIASLVFFTARGLTPQALAKKATAWLNGFVRNMQLVRNVATKIFKRVWTWFSVKLLSGPAKRNAGIPSISGATSDVAMYRERLMAPVPINPSISERRLASSVMV